MFAQPSNSNAYAKIARWAVTALIALSLLNAGRATWLETRCGAACQQIIHRQGF